MHQRTASWKTFCHDHCEIIAKHGLPTDLRAFLKFSGKTNYFCAMQNNSVFLLIQNKIKKYDCRKKSRNPTRQDAR